MRLDAVYVPEIAQVYYLYIITWKSKGFVYSGTGATLCSSSSLQNFQGGLKASDRSLYT